MRLPVLLPALLLLSACTAEPTDPVLDDRVDVQLWTVMCEPDEEPEDHFVVEVSPFVIGWEALCVRDGRDVSWWALKISYWDDRAEDAWNVWLIDPTVQEVTYGQPGIDGASDPNVPNTMFPDALERVGPASLDPGEYRLEVWAVVDDYLDSQRNEVRVTVVP